MSQSREANCCRVETTLLLSKTERIKKERIRLLLLPRMVSSSQPQIDAERQNFGLKAPIDVGNKLEKQNKKKLKEKKKAKTHKPKKRTVWQVTNVSCVMLCCSLPTCNNKSVLVLKNGTLFIFIFMSAS